ncbi:MAG TPA: flagellar basal body L-ring protein FlgH [Polyangiaceae bacterium]|jgi:flagellar L-ring protein precursor FlgH|nr:flagellar basal body L-ring protein FlgH [Polyangiaceae bacterium]
MSSACVRVSLLGLIATVAIACGPAHIKSFEPQERSYEAGKYAATQEGSRPATGSVYSDAQAGYLEDARAMRVGDVVMVHIDEQADAQGAASTELGKDSSRTKGLVALLELLPQVKNDPNINVEDLLSSSTDFDGKGSTQRAGKLKANIGVRVKKELPNGDLFVEGTKVVMINHEEYHLYISGVLRPSDIMPDNSVDSELMADARVEFTGRGDINDQVERGWLTQFLDFINPF